jgi:hypothetical protein
VRTRVSFAFTGILIVALIAVVGFAAFSAQDGDTTADDPELAEGIDAAVPLSASGRILGAVVAAALTPDPEIGTVDDGGPEPETAAEEVPLEAAASSETTTTTTEPTTTTTTTTTAPKESSTANVKPPDTTAPEIEVTSPKDGATVDERVIEFRGTTEAGVSVTSGSYSADVTENGEWTIKLVLREGRNRAYFTATDDAGNSETASVSVVYDPPETTTSTSTSTTTTTTTEPPPDTGGPRDVEEWRPLVEQYFQAELVDEALWVIKCESKGDPAAYNSRSGASGLFQFIPNTWNWASSNAGWAGASPFDPEANVAAAAWLVNWSLDRGNDAWAHWSCKP